METNYYLTLEEAALATGKPVSWLNSKVLQGELDNVFRSEQRLVLYSSLEALCGPLSLQGIHNLPVERTVYSFPRTTAPSVSDESNSSGKIKAHKNGSHSAGPAARTSNRKAEARAIKGPAKKRKDSNTSSSTRKAQSKPKSTSKKLKKKSASARSRTVAVQPSAPLTQAEKLWRLYDEEVEEFKRVLREVDRQIHQETELLKQSRSTGRIYDPQNLERLTVGREKLIQQYRTRLRQFESSGVTITAGWKGIKRDCAPGTHAKSVTTIQANKGKPIANRQRRMTQARATRGTVKMSTKDTEVLNTFDPRRGLEVWEKPSIAKRGTYQSPAR